MFADGVEWAISQGVAIREKVAIQGASYGGFATLAGLSKSYSKILGMPLKT